MYLEKYRKVIETIDRFFKEYNDLRSPRPLGTLAIAYYHLGDLDKSNQLLQEIKAQSEESPVGSPSFYLAMIYAQMGEIDTAFEWLEKAYQDHEVEMYWLKVEPPFEPKKKVYRLMSEAHLLHTTNRISTYGKRAFVQSRKVDASYPMQHLTMDIK